MSQEEGGGQAARDVDPLLISNSKRSRGAPSANFLYSGPKRSISCIQLFALRSSAESRETREKRKKRRRRKGKRKERGGKKEKEEEKERKRGKKKKKEGGRRAKRAGCGSGAIRQVRGCTRACGFVHGAATRLCI